MNEPECTIKFHNTFYKAIGWYQNGKRHRLDGPAAEYANGTKYWYQNGEFHRLDGPAAEYANGDKYWIQNGKLHRLDGPAAEYASGNKEWYIEGVRITQAEHTKRTSTSVKACANKAVIIDGAEYILVPKE